MWSHEFELIHNFLFFIYLLADLSDAIFREKISVIISTSPYHDSVVSLEGFSLW